MFGVVEKGMEARIFMTDKRAEKVDCDLLNFSRLPCDRPSLGRMSKAIQRPFSCRKVRGAKK